MKGKTILILGIFILVLTTIGGIILADKWYDYDVRKCNSLKGNDYYYTQNDCYTTYNLPLGTIIFMFILITLIPYIISILMILIGLHVLEII